ncbi:hypothetical protein ABT160_38355, partial [Streptomyces sp. NPDC001941]|uniref:hypothetical protein n=1 Tax=Streptomyces sp. NPDC001941 TaxID=3154659 RepID=UPI003322816F
MENAPPQPVQELAAIDSELVRLDARRAQLLARRAWLLHHALPLRPAGPPGGAAPAARWGAPADASPPSVQNVLLALGGVLLAVAAIAFTLVSWGSMGIAGRSAVLSLVTVAALGAPVVLLRRGLASTAEAVAALGLLLTVLDAYAVHAVGLAETGGVGFAAAASAVLAALWAGYGRVLGKLRLPLPAAVLTAQLPLPLWALASHAPAVTITWSLLATAALDVLVALYATSSVVRGFAWTTACVAGGYALLAAGVLSLGAPLGPATVLLGGAALALLAGWRRPAAALPGAVVAGLAAVAAVGGVVRDAVPGAWAVPGYLACALALLALVRTSLPRPLRTGFVAASAAVQALAVLWALPLVAAGLAGGAARVADVWAGAPVSAGDALPGGLPWAEPLPAPLVLLAVAAALVVLARLPRVPGAAARCAALALGWAALTTVPVALDLPYAAVPAVHTAAGAALLLLAVRPERLPAGPPAALTPTALALGAASGGCAALYALASRPATFTVLAALLLALAGCAALARRTWLREVLSCGAVVTATALAGAPLLGVGRRAAARPCAVRRRALRPYGGRA